MAKSLIVYMAFVCLLAPRVAFAEDGLPFTFSVVSAEDTDRGGDVWSVVTVKLRNGSTFLKSANFNCRLQNANGLTWQVEGRTLSYDPGEERSFRVVGQAPGDFRKPTGATCSVTSFDRSAPLQ